MAPGDIAFKRWNPHHRLLRMLFHLSPVLGFHFPS
jgi:hypothetical protein